MQRKKYIFITMNGLGYIYPCVKLAHILQNYGHHVLFMTAQEHSIILANYGLEHIPIKTNNNPFLNLHRWASAETALNDFRAAEQVINKYRPDVIVTSPLAMISFLLAEKYNLPTINVGFCEYIFPGKISTDDAKQWRINGFTEAYNSFRQKVGFPAIKVSNLDSPIIGTRHLLRSVPELYPDSYLPDQVKCVGGLYFEPEYINKNLLNFIYTAKAENRKICYIQMGRLFKNADVWDKLITVLSEFQMNFIVDIGRADYSISNARLHKNFFLSQFIPIGAIKKDIDFVICTGQTTSVISAIVHGLPILTIPHSADSIELSNRLESKSLAISIYDPININRENLVSIFKRLERQKDESTLIEFNKLFLSYNDSAVYNVIKAL